MTNLDQDPAIIQSQLLDRLRQDATQARIAGDNESARSIEDQIEYIEAIISQTQTSQNKARALPPPRLRLPDRPLDRPPPQTARAAGGLHQLGRVHRHLLSA